MFLSKFTLLLFEDVTELLKYLSPMISINATGSYVFRLLNRFQAKDWKSNFYQTYAVIINNEVSNNSTSQAFFAFIFFQVTFSIIGKAL